MGRFGQQTLTLGGCVSWAQDGTQTRNNWWEQLREAAAVWAPTHNWSPDIPGLWFSLPAVKFGSFLGFWLFLPNKSGASWCSWTCRFCWFCGTGPGRGESTQGMDKQGPVCCVWRHFQPAFCVCIPLAATRGNTHPIMCHKNRIESSCTAQIKALFFKINTFGTPL